MDTELERLRLELARVKKDRDQILKERNQYLSQVQYERTTKAELSSKNTEMSNQLLARDSEISDLKRTNQDLTEQLELALSVKMEEDRKPTLFRPSTRSPLRATPAKSRRIPRMSVSVEVPVRPKISSSRTAAARESPIIVSDDDEDVSIKLKGEVSSPIRGEQPIREDLPPGPSIGLEASDNDDPFADDYELLQQDHNVSPPAEEPEERSLSPLSMISSLPLSRATTELTDLPTYSDLSNLKDDEMNVDAMKPESSKSSLKRKRDEEAFETVASTKKPNIKKRTSAKAEKTIDITQYEPVAKLYLSNIPTFTTTPSPESDFFFSRKQFNRAAGGTTCTLLVTIKEWKTAGTVLKHPIHCVWPSRKLNPLTVDGIGAAGLLFAGRQDILNHSPLYVFRSIKRDGAKWEYCGNYEAQKIGQLAVEHFRLYPEKSKEKWGNKISTSRSKDLRLYLDMRVRIALRKMGEEITLARVEREAQALIKDKDRRGMDISPEDVIEALCAGDEKLDVVLVRCVGYDHEFIHDLKRDVAAYIERGESPPKKKPRVAKGKKKQASPSPSPSPPPTETEEIAAGPRRSKRERKPRVMSEEWVDATDDDDD